MSVADTDHAALLAFLERVKPVLDTQLDSYFICDNDRTIIAHGSQLLELIPKAPARGVAGKKCYDIMRFTICENECIARRCSDAKRSMILDNIDGRPGDEPRHFTLTALPIYDDAGKIVGALETQRDTTETQNLQTKYRELLDRDSTRSTDLETELNQRTKELIDAHKTIREIRSQILEYKKGVRP